MKPFKTFFSIGMLGTTFFYENHILGLKTKHYGGHSERQFISKVAQFFVDALTSTTGEENIQKSFTGKDPVLLPIC